MSNMVSGSNREAQTFINVVNLYFGRFTTDEPSCTQHVARNFMCTSLVVATDDVDTSRLVPFQREEQEQDFQRVPTSIHDVPIKQIDILRRGRAVLEENPQDIL